MSDVCEFAMWIHCRLWFKVLHWILTVPSRSCMRRGWWTLVRWTPPRSGSPNRARSPPPILCDSGILLSVGKKGLLGFEIWVVCRMFASNSVCQQTANWSILGSGANCLSNASEGGQYMLPGRLFVTLSANEFNKYPRTMAARNADVGSASEVSRWAHLLFLAVYQGYGYYGWNFQLILNKMMLHLNKIE